MNYATCVRADEEIDLRTRVLIAPCLLSSCKYNTRILWNMPTCASKLPHWFSKLLWYAKLQMVDVSNLNLGKDNLATEQHLPDVEDTNVSFMIISQGMFNTFRFFSIVRLSWVEDIELKFVKAFTALLSSKFDSTAMAELTNRYLGHWRIKVRGMSSKNQHGHSSRFGAKSLWTYYTESYFGWLAFYEYVLATSFPANFPPYPIYRL